LLDQFVGRVVHFDTSAARRYADLAVKTRTAGKGFPTPDGYIAAIAAAHGFAVASRDTRAFNAAGLIECRAEPDLALFIHYVLRCSAVHKILTRSLSASN